MPLILLMLWVISGIACTRKAVPEAQESVRKSSTVLSEIQQSQVQFYFFEGTSSKLVGKWELAEQGFLRALAIDPLNATCAYEAARMALQAGDAGRALNHSRKATEADPSNPWFLKLEAQLLQQNGQAEEALKVWKKITLLSSVQGNEHAAEAWESMGMIYLQQRQFPQALDCYHALEKQIGAQPEILEQKRHIYLLMNKKEAAVREARRLIALYPEDMTYRLNLVQMHADWNQYREALAVVKEAMDQASIAEQGRLHLAAVELHYSLNQSAEAEKHFLLALEGRSLGNEELSQGMFRMLERQGNAPDKKESWLRKGLEIHPKNPLFLALLAENLVKQDRLQEAAETYRLSLAVPEQQIQFVVWQQYLSCLLELAQFDSLEVAARRALDLYPDQALTYFFLGVALQRNQKPESALEKLGQGLQFLVDQPELEAQFHIAMGDLQHRLENHSESDRHYAKALAIQPGNTLVLNNFAYYLSLRRTNLDSALAMSTRALEAEPGNASYLDTYAWVLFQLGRYDDALEPVRKAVALSPDNATLLEHFGDILFRAHRVEEARLQWNKALDSESSAASKEGLRLKIQQGLP
jgi:tetratricopeptide (TPR) repeat protein